MELFKNWIWVSGKDFSSDEWKRSFEKIQTSGIDAILLNGNEKVFEKALPIAYKMGIEIHTWFITMLGNNELVKNHPDWFAVSDLGESAAEKPQYVNYYKWLCPNHPEVQEYLLNKVEDLSKIPENSGVHLDYIRFCDVILPIGIQPDYDLVQTKEEPQYDYCYCHHCKKKFKEKYGTDPKELIEPSQNKDWLQFRYDSITNLVKKMAEKVHLNNKIITAAVFPTIMQKNVRQQWHKWDLDAVFPMMYHSFYNKNIDWIETETRNGINLLNNTKLYSGLFLPAIEPDKLQNAIELAMKGGAAGVSLFDFNSMSSEHWGKLCLG